LISGRTTYGISQPRKNTESTQEEVEMKDGKKFVVRLPIEEKEKLACVAKERGFTLVSFCKIALAGSNPNIDLLPIEQIRFMQMEKIAKGLLRDSRITNKINAAEAMLIERKIAAGSEAKAFAGIAPSTKIKDCPNVDRKQILLTLESSVVARLDQEAMICGRFSRNEYARRKIIAKIDEVEKLGTGRQDSQSIEEVIQFLQNLLLCDQGY
jgi:hypothetical protein